MQSASTCNEYFVLAIKQSGRDYRIDLQVIVSRGKVDCDRLLCQSRRGRNIHLEMTRDIQPWMRCKIEVGDHGIWNRQNTVWYEDEMTYFDQAVAILIQKQGLAVGFVVDGGMIEHIQQRNKY